jgi:predicted O-linked N-acetylglucosamine transferase (SPINDLY family)
MAQVTIDQALEIAVEHHQAGRLAEAEAIYRQVLAHDPGQAHALHLLGVLACQTGHHQAAIELIRHAIAVAPAVAEFHSNLGESYRLSGQSDAAVASLHRALALDAGSAAAYNHLGMALRDCHQPDEAAVAYERAIALRPDLAEAHNNLGILLREQGRPDAAIAAFERAIAVRSEYAGAHSNLGNALWDSGRRGAALAAFERAIALQPDLAEAQNNLGTALRHEGRLDEAIAAYERAIALRPDLAEYPSSLANALWQANRLDAAIAAAGRALALDPGHADAHNNLGNALKDSGRRDEAILAYSRAIALRPDHAEAQTNLGNALWEKGQLDEARAAARRALELKPDSAQACNALGNVCKEQGRLDEALGWFRKAIEVDPDCAVAASNLLFTLHYHSDLDAQAILAEHRAWAWHFAEPLAAQIRPHDNDRTPDRRITVGFLSPDFRSHPVGHSLLPFFSARNRRQFEIVGYCDVRRPDAVTRRLEALSDRWHATAGLSDRQLAELIRTDRIDILVDLALHTAGNRMLVFARKPAPLQLTMLGLPATTGLATMDYRLTDPFLDPPGLTDDDYTEQSIRLPHCFWPYQPPDESPPVGELPARENGFVTFGCLNQFSKLTRPALRLWRDILQALPGSRLLIQAQPGSHLDPVRSLFERGVIAGDRVEFVAKLPRHQYFQRFHRIDLALDPFPYNGHTSTLDSLWMGVPVITLVGRTGVGRGGVSLLSNAGLPGFIAGTPDRYVDLAVRWASDLPALAALRAGLRERMMASPMLDGRQFAAAVEAVFRRVWEHWCSQSIAL